MNFAEAWAQLSQTWPTVVLSVVLGLGGGVLGALIAAATQRKLASASAREEARRALRAYERCLKDLGAQFESSILDDGSRSFSETTWTSLAEAREVAYAFIDRLPSESRDLVRHGWIEDTWPGENPLTTPDALTKRGRDLGEAIDRAFPSAS